MGMLIYRERRELVRDIVGNATVNYPETLTGALVSSMEGGLPRRACRKERSFLGYSRTRGGSDIERSRGENPSPACLLEIIEECNYLRVKNCRNFSYGR